jgi:4-amino-4-deoxy-L-arabinose transferase-like glycosyltransferase
MTATATRTTGIRIRDSAGRRLAVWRSPTDQPAWSRPVLLVLAGLAAVGYTWGINADGLEPYYAAAVRSMSMSWHDLIYGAFDPAGTVTLDKLPGAFWPQALSVRVFGVHVWAVVLPQVVEGVLTVLVLHRVVRRLAGPVAGLLAAAILVASPATMGLNRGNISDTLMTLLLVVAADLTVTAILDGRIGWLAGAGLCVGLAFQAKMIQAWLVVPALGLAYLLAGMGPGRRRVAAVIGAGVLMGIVSLSWITAVSLVPGHDRPYVDGSHHDSLFEQVFVYNGFGRFGDQTPLQQLAGQSLSFGLAPAPHASWHRLLSGGFGRDTGWLMPAAAVALIGGIVARRKQPRTDHLRTHFVLWGSWLIILFVVFSTASTINAYYTGALSPPIAALCGGALPLACGSRRGRALLAATVAGAAAYGWWLLPGTGTGLPGWLAPALVTLAVLAVILAFVSWATRRLTAVSVTAAAGALLLVPVTAAVSVPVTHLGPFDTPFQPASATDTTRALLVTIPREIPRDIPGIERVRRGAPYLMATQSALLAAPFIFATGQEAFPIGGFTGTTPTPTLSQLTADAAAGRFHLVLLRNDRDPRLAWVTRHCLNVTSRASASSRPSATPRVLTYYCL